MNEAKRGRRKFSVKNNCMKNKIKLLEGGLIGAALGVAAGMFVKSDAGKKLGRDIKKTSADFQAYLAPRIKKLKNVGEADYKAFVKSATENYRKAKKLSVKEGAILAKEAHKIWEKL